MNTSCKDWYEQWIYNYMSFNNIKSCYFIFIFWHFFNEINVKPNELLTKLLAHWLTYVFKFLVMYLFFEFFSSCVNICMIHKQKKQKNYQNFDTKFKETLTLN